MEILPGFCFFHFLFLSFFFFLFLAHPSLDPHVFLFTPAADFSSSFFFFLPLGAPPRRPRPRRFLIVCRVFTTYPASSRLRFLLPFLISYIYTYTHTLNCVWVRVWVCARSLALIHWRRFLSCWRCAGVQHTPPFRVLPVFALTYIFFLHAHIC